MIRRIAWVSLLGIGGCCGMFASVPDDEVLCELAREEWADDLEDAIQLRPPEFACEDLLTDAGQGEGSVVVVASQLLPGDRGGRILAEQARRYTLRRYDQGWRAEDPEEPELRDRTEIPVGVAVGADVDPAGIASAGNELPGAASALQVPGAWFAGPWPDVAPGEHLEGSALRSWEKDLEDQVCMTETDTSSPAGILGELDRYGIAGEPEPMHWVDPLDTRSLFQGGGAAYVEVTPDLIRVDGWPVVSLSEGKPKSDQLRGMMVAPLYDRLQEMADDAKAQGARWPGCPFHGRILIGADRRVPAGTLTAVIYTAGQAQFGEPYLLVKDPEPTPLAELLDREAPAGNALKVIATEGSFRIVEVGEGAEMGEAGEELATSGLLAAVTAAQPSDGLVETGAGATVGDAVAALDAIHAQGSSCVTMGRGDAELLTVEQVPELPEGRAAAELPEVVSVIPFHLPSIRPGNDPCAVFYARPKPLSDLGDLGSLFGSEGIGLGASPLAGGVIGSQYGNQYGSGGLGSRGSGLGGGGTGEGLGGLGTRGRGRGASGYGTGGGYFGKKSGSTPGISTGDPIILGQLDKEVIDKVIRQHLAQIRYCYQKELNRDPSISGKVVIEFTVAADGTVSSASTNSTSMNNEVVEKCICQRFLRFKFPEPEGGGIVIVTYPFVFSNE